MPVFSEKTRELYSGNLIEAKRKLEASPNNYDAMIWHGRRLAYLGLYYEAIDQFSTAIDLEPKNAEAYRHRGHRWLTLRCFEKAKTDFEKAASLIRGQKDQVEPDGLPNAQNIPTSTLQSNIWYHLGLTHFILRDYPSALKAYKKCIKVSNNPDMFVATANWYYITLLKMGLKRDAEDLLKTIDQNVTLLENQDYHKILLLYKNKESVLDPNKYLEEHKDLSLLSFGFGLGNYLLENGRCKDAQKVFQKILSGNQWSAFGYIAAEKELTQLACKD
jgi:tetratricopeptide (TPR) repeat protein